MAVDMNSQAPDSAAVANGTLHEKQPDEDSPPTSEPTASTSENATSHSSVKPLHSAANGDLKPQDIPTNGAKTPETIPAEETGFKLPTDGPLKIPIPNPLPSSKVPTRPALTGEQESKYASVLAKVSTWQSVPATTARRAPQQALSDNERMWLTRECLLRYLRATKWNVSQALARLQGTLSWRREYGADTFTFPYISPENETGKQVILGYDNDARPCLYLKPGKQNTEMSDRQIHHLCFMLDRTVDMMPAGQENACLIINFSGASSGKIPTVGQARAVLNILQNHNPERLGRALISETPWYVNTFFKLISPFIDPVTREKMKFNESLRKWVPAKNASEAANSQIISEAVHLKDVPPITYKIKNTGYYCVGTFHFNNLDYKGVVEFRNAFGELPAAQIAKLPFYAAITIVYAFVAIAWGMLYFVHRRDILAVQNYITAILVFLVVEMFMTWLFYDYQNRHGMSLGAKALLVVVSVLSAGRNSFSFFLLLIVCMGYGVVKPTLGKTMTYVRWLAITHFVFGVIYAVASLSVTPENAGPLVLLVVLPLAATLTAFYVWTLNSLNATTKDLIARKQTIKASMYRKLWYCILLSIVVIFVFFFVNSWIFAGQNDDDFVPNHWKGRWFILDGWLNLVYFFDVAFVAYVWRPTANNRRFAMSDEIAQDEDGFEIASLRDSLDDDDLEATANESKLKPSAPMYDASPGSANRDVSPLPAPVPQKPMPFPRESLERETIFAVGDEDRDSDVSEDEDGERKGLTSKR